MKLTVHTYSEADTVALGRRIGTVLRAGDVIALRGGLGAGKTHSSRESPKAWESTRLSSARLFH
ncbi:hypothetical protein HMPREF0080_01118 [Anaeroglobus geminatus F0357]|uniref:tRNA threonylcarbamoyladenosine biosynthesis protein TsaE n=1 Tax=Anaeroglobus geminatus F0357 TaxID=861450 RepID=G9YHI7_9FIRM|nr:hypothetical protein HMPREF0080_01118 [Anaeroglobus geminatus F0357]